jgi:hypothetical protein
VSASRSTPTSLGPKAILATGGVLLAISMTLLFGSPPPALATGNFCPSVHLGAGQECWGEARKGLDYAAVKTHETAGCVAIANTSNVLVTEWKCGPATKGSIAAEVWYTEFNPELYYKPVIFDNQGKPGEYGGLQNCYLGAC